MNTKFHHIVSFVAALFFFGGCDGLNYVDYIVSNQSDQSLQLRYRFWDAEAHVFRSHDTTLALNIGQQRTLYVRQVIGNNVRNPEIGSDTVWSLSSLRVLKEDSILVQKNFIESKRWVYRTIDANHAELTCTIGEKDLR